MQRRLLLLAALALFNAAGANAQAASSTPVALDQFLGNVASVVRVISSAVSQQTATPSPSSSSSSSSPSSPVAASATPTSSAPAASSTAAAPPPQHSNSRRNLIITIVSCIVGALLLIALILTCVFCCLTRRRRRSRKQAVVPAEDDEKTTFQPTPPLNPGRTYSPHSPRHVPSMDQQPTVPMIASAAKPGMQQHPSHHAQNPFVPVPPNRRGDLHSRNGPTGVSAHDPLITPPITTTTTTRTYPDTQPLAASRSRSRSRSRSHSSTLPTHTTTDRPSTPFGLSGIGRPYEDMHVHVLQTEEPSPELRHSLHNREPIQRYSTPPLVPSRSSHRQSGTSGTPDLIHNSFSGDSSSSSSTNGSGSGEEWRRSQVPRWEQHQQHLSGTAQSNGLPAPPVPWDDGYGRRHSGGRGDLARNGNGNDGSTGWIGGQERRGSRSPANSLSGTPRRLRFSDVPPEKYGDERRYIPGVGEAL